MFVCVCVCVLHSFITYSSPFTDEQVTGGNIAVKAKLGFITLLNKTYPLCTEAKAINETCPLAPVSDGTIQINEALPNEPIKVRHSVIYTYYMTTPTMLTFIY